MPFLVVIVSLHLSVACLLRLVMRRAGVDPWIATAAAALFVCFGTGYDNIVYAFQIGFVGAVAFGLTQLLLADHDGPISRSDCLGLAAGLAALMCSGVGVTMVAVVGIATLYRRGISVALFHTVPLAAAYVAWFAAFGRGTYERGAGVGEIARFVGTDLRVTFVDLGQVPGVGYVIAAALLVGLLLAWAKLDAAERRRRGAAPAALLAGSIVFLVITAFGRAAHVSPFLRQPATASRYLYIAAALTFPALAVAVDAIARRVGRAGVPIAIALLVVGIPGNVLDMHSAVDHSRKGIRVSRQLILTTAWLPLTREIPRSFEPWLFAPHLTTGWLVAAARSGELPRPYPASPELPSRVALALVVLGRTGAHPTGSCAPVLTQQTMTLHQGDALVIDRGAALDLATVQDGTAMAPLTHGARNHAVTLTVINGSHALRIAPLEPGTVALCRVHTVRS
jgi:hypothetical protein